MNRIKGFTIYREYYDLITLLDKTEQADLILAIVEYMFEDKKPDLNSDQIKIFNNLKRPLDKSKIKSNNKQNQIEMKSKQNQNEIETTTNDVSHQDVIVIVKDNITNSNEDNKEVIEEKEQKEETIYSYIESNFGITLSGNNFLDVEYWLKVYSNTILHYAVDKTISASKRTLNYFFGILSNWKQSGYKTLEEIKNNEPKSKSKKEIVPKWLGQEQTSTKDDGENEEFKKFVQDFRTNKKKEGKNV